MTRKLFISDAVFCNFTSEFIPTMRFFKPFLLIAVLFLTQIVFAQQPKLRAYLDTKQFYSPTDGNYVEIYLQFSGSTIQYKGVDGGLQAELAISINILNESTSVASNVYRLQSPLMKDSIVEDFYDVQRFAVKPGKYSLSIELVDLNKNSEPVKSKSPIVIEELGESISISDISTIEYASKGDGSSPYYKSGYDMIPRISTFYPKELQSIPVYLELYNTLQLEDSVCGIKQFIVNSETGQEVADFTTMQKLNTSDVVPLLRNVDITNLTTGKYTLNYTILSRSMMELSTQSYEFERSNDLEVVFNPETILVDPAFQASITNDSVTFFLESLIPISKHTEVKNLIATLKTKDRELQRKHIQAFWLKTAPNNTNDAWLKYKAQVLLVQKLYSTNFQKGYETDRGRVYLQYGSPSSIMQKETSATEYPYEIWVYNKIGAFSNKRFIFYNPDLVNNGYRLLHSDMVGELKNAGWSQALSRRTSTNGNVDDPNANHQQGYGLNSNDLFRQY